MIVEPIFQTIEEQPTWILAWSDTLQIYAATVSKLLQKENIEFVNNQT